MVRITVYIFSFLFFSPGCSFHLRVFSKRSLSCSEGFFLFTPMVNSKYSWFFPSSFYLYCDRLENKVVYFDFDQVDRFAVNKII
jgi:hypothetical protein